MKPVAAFLAYAESVTSFDPSELARVPQVKALLALAPVERAAAAVEVAEDLAAQVRAKRSPWLHHSVIELVIGRKQLPWTREQVEALAHIAAAINDAGTTRFPLAPLVTALEQYRAAGGKPSAKLKTAARKVAGYLRGNGVAAARLAQRLTKATG